MDNSHQRPSDSAFLLPLKFVVVAGIEPSDPFRVIPPRSTTGATQQLETPCALYRIAPSSKTF